MRCVADDKEGKGHVYLDEELSKIVDAAFEKMDKNDDGLIEFAEYRQASLNP